MEKTTIPASTLVTANKAVALSAGDQVRLTINGTEVVEFSYDVPAGKTASLTVSATGIESE